MLEINYVPDGETYSNGGYIITTYREISAEEYVRLDALPNLDSAFNETLPDSIICGYGYYGCGIIHREDGKYFFYWKRGSSCD